MKYQIRISTGEIIGYLETGVELSPGMHLNLWVPELGGCQCLITRVVLNCSGELPSCEFQKTIDHLVVYIDRPGKLSRWLAAQRKMRTGLED